MYLTAFLMILVFIAFLTTEKNKTRKLKPFDLNNTLPLRGLLAMLIVCHHVSQTASGDIGTFTQHFEVLGMPIVAVFFLISGYGLFISFQKKGDAYLDGFLAKRYSKILPAFIVLSLISVGIWYYFGKPLDEQLNRYGHGATPLPYSWFIYAIIYVYAAFYLSAKIGKKTLMTGVIFTTLLLIYIVVVKYLLIFNGYWYQSILSTAAGYFVGYYESRMEKIFDSHKILFFGGVIAMLFLSFCGMCKLIPIAGYLATVWVIAIAISVYVIIRALGMFNWKFLRWVGDFSLEVYLIHGIFILFLTKIPDFPTGIWLYLVTLACSLPAAFAIHRLAYLRPFSRKRSIAG